MVTAMARDAGRNKLFERPTTARGTRTEQRRRQCEEHAAQHRHRQAGDEQGLGVPSVGQWREQDLADETDQEAGTGDEAEAVVGEAVLVLQIAEQREDHAVGDADAGGGEEERIPASNLLAGHAGPCE
jgi:hypothetical protein